MCYLQKELIFFVSLANRRSSWGCKRKKTMILGWHRQCRTPNNIYFLHAYQYELQLETYLCKHRDFTAKPSCIQFIIVPLEIWKMLPWQKVWPCSPAYERVGQDLRTIISFHQRRLSHIENIFCQFQNEGCQTCIKRQKAGVLPGEHVVQGEVRLDLALLVDQLHDRNLGKREFRIGKMPNGCQRTLAEVMATTFLMPTIRFTRSDNSSIILMQSRPSLRTLCSRKD